MTITPFDRTTNGLGTCLVDPHNKVFLDKIDEITRGINQTTLQSTTGVIAWDGIPGNGLLGINADTTKFDVSGGCALLVDRTDPENPISTVVPWTQQLGIPADNLATSAGTFVGVNLKTGIIVQQVVDFSKDQLEYIARLGRLGHFDRLEINQVFDFPLVAETNLDLAHFVMALGVVRTSGLNIEGNIADLSLKRNVGTTMRIGAGKTRDIQNTPLSPEEIAFDMLPAYCDGTGNSIIEASTTQIDTLHFDECAGSLSTLGNNKYGNVYIYFFPYKDGDTTFQLYGHGEYNNISQAVGDLANVTIRDDLAGGIVLAAISFKKGITDLPAAILLGEATITNLGITGIGSAAGGGGGGPIIGLILGVTDVNVSSYDVLVTDQIINHQYSITNTSTVTLPTDQLVRGRTLFINDAGGNAGTNPITLNTQASARIDGEHTAIMDVNWGTIIVYCDGFNWFTIKQDVSIQGVNGFINQTDSTLTWTDTTPARTLSIQPTSDSFVYFVEGVPYRSTGDTIQITDVEGTHIIYYDKDTLTEAVNPTSGEVDVLIRTCALVSIVYWDTSASEAIYVGEERHGKVMSSSSHAYHHFIDGLRYVEGLAIVDMDVDGSGNDATAAQFSTGSGAVTDEDLYKAISAVGSTTGLPIYYMTGNEEWNRYINTGYSVRTFDGTNTTRLAWNENVGGVWQLTEISNNDFVLCHVFATTEKDKPMIAIMGQNDYATIIAARDGAEVEIRNLTLNNIQFPEYRAIATVIFQTSDGYSNNVKGRVRSTSDGDNYIDWSNEVISRVEVSTSDHNSLNNVQLAQSGVTNGHINDAEQVIGGAKDFFNGIKTSSNPADILSGYVYWNGSAWVQKP